MRGADTKQALMFSTISPEKRVPADHPLRPVKRMADQALADLSPVFDEMYSAVGRPSIPPERLLKSLLLMAFHSIRSERLFCEHLDYNLLFRWFLDMSMDEPSFDHSSFSRNRDRLLEHDVAGQFFIAVVNQARAAGLMSNEHFTVDGSLIEAWASIKSFRPRDEKPEDRKPPDDPGNPTVNFHGEKRSNATHASTTDPEARLAKKGKGKEAKLSFSANALMENRKRPAGRRQDRGGHVHRGDVRGDRNGRELAGRLAPDHDGWRQGVRRPGVHRRVQVAEHHASCGAEHGPVWRFANRHANHAASRLRDQSTQAKARRGDLRLVEDHRWLPQDAIPRRPEDATRRLLRRCRLQPAPHGQADRCDMRAGAAVARDARRRGPGHNPQLGLTRFRGQQDYAAFSSCRNRRSKSTGLR